MRRFTQSDKAKALAQVPMFANLSKKHLVAVARNTTQVALPAGTEITGEAAHGDEAFLILEGKVAVRRKGRRLTTLGAGDVVGEMSLLDGKPRSASCVTIEDSVLLVMSRREFNTLIEEVPSIARKLLVTLSERLRAADRQIIPSPGGAQRRRPSCTGS